MAQKTVTVTLSAEDKTGAAVASAKNNILGISFATKEAAQGFNRIGDSVKKLGADSLGLKGPVGNIAETLVGFGPSGFVGIAALAGIGLIAAGFRKLKAMAEDAKVAAQELGVAIAEAMGMGAEQRLAIAIDKYRLAKDRFDSAEGGTGLTGVLRRLDLDKRKADLDRATAEVITATTAVATKNVKENTPKKTDKTPLFGGMSESRTEGPKFDFSGVDDFMKKYDAAQAKIKARLDTIKDNKAEASLQTQLDAIAASLGPQTKELTANLKSIQFDELRDDISNNLANALVGGIEAGIGMAVASGNIGTGFKMLTGSLLKGLGSAMVQFGVASLKFATLMEAIKKALTSFLPGGGIAASVAMIAVGSALGGVAAKMFSGVSESTGGAFNPINNPRANFDSLGVANATTTVTVVGGFLNLTDPRQAKAFSDAISGATGRRLIVQPNNP